MPRYGQRTAEETSEAGSQAFKGAVVGAAKVSLLDRPSLHSLSEISPHTFFLSQYTDIDIF